MLTEYCTLRSFKWHLRDIRWFGDGCINPMDTPATLRQKKKSVRGEIRWVRWGNECNTSGISNAADTRRQIFLLIEVSSILIIYITTERKWSSRARGRNKDNVKRKKNTWKTYSWTSSSAVPAVHGREIRRTRTSPLAQYAWLLLPIRIWCGSVEHYAYQK